MVRAFCVLAWVLLTACTAPVAPTLGDRDYDRCVYRSDCGAMRRRCERGEAASCAALGSVHATAEPWTGNADFSAGVGELLRACRLNTSACEAMHSVSSFLECRGRDPLAVQLRRLACDEGYPPACERFAEHLLAGVDVPRDTARAAKLFAQVCDAEDRFPDYQPIAPGPSYPYLDPMVSQLMACLYSERLVELHLAEAPRTTPEDALRLANARSNIFGKRRLMHGHLTEEQLAPARAAVERDIGAALTTPPETVREQRRSIPCPIGVPSRSPGFYR